MTFFLRNQRTTRTRDRLGRLWRAVADRYIRRYFGRFILAWGRSKRGRNERILGRGW